MAAPGASALEGEGARVGDCPFCGSKVPEDLVTFGGVCPTCFAEIPGEEAATDPGEQVKAQNAQRDRMRATARTLLPLVVIVPVLGVLALLALWFLTRPAPEVVLLDFDEFEDYPMPELVAAAPEPDDGVAAVEPAEAAGTPEGAATGGSVAPAPSPRPQPARAAPEPAPALGFGLDVNASRRAEVLDDPEAIRQMIGDRLTGYAPRLNACYERELKNDEDLAGRWRVGFTVDKEGRVREPVAEALSGSVPQFEACLVSEMARWTFGRITQDQPVRKTFTFRPAG